MQVFWFIPTIGDGRYLGDPRQSRETNLPYLKQIATAVDELGFEGVLLPTGNLCEDAWVVASSVMPFTRRLKFLVAVRPGISSATLAARMAATFDRLSEGRLLINVVAGGDRSEAAADGVFVSHDERYEITDEFLTIWRKILAGGKTSFQGKHWRVENAQVYYPAVQKPYPPLYLGGSSDAAIEVAAKHVDVYLTWGEPPAQVAEKIAEVRAAAAAQGRTVRFGIRLHVIVRETTEQAWSAANTLIRYVDRETVAKAHERLDRFDSEGQRRMASLVQQNAPNLEVSPNLWTGIGLLRRGAATALVGDPSIVAERMLEYADLGIETFIFSGYPHLEEAYRVAELLFPLLPLSHAEATRTFRLPQPEELVGSEFRPKTKASDSRG
jgi:alkanesulfonate monooxygenase